MSLLAELKRRNVLRVAAGYAAVSWLLIQIVGTVFPFFGFSDAAIRGVMIVLIIGFIPALAASWVFEWTPDGLRRDSEVDGTAPSAIAMGKRLDRIVIVALVLAVGYFAVDKFVFDPAEDAAIREEAREQGRTEALVGSYGDKSIAVLPFVDMSPDGDQAYFSEGIAEELLNLLARIPELRVISRSSAFTIVEEGLEIPEIAERLNAAHILEGSVRKSADTLRITAQLIDARSDTHLWSATYDRKLGDIFAIQDEIAAKVVKDLQLQLLGELPTTLRTDPRAHELTLQARHIAITGGYSGASEKAYELLEQALAIDPDYVPALLLISIVDYWLHSATDEAAAMYKRGDAIMARLAELAPENPNYIGWLAWDKFEHEKDMEAAARGFDEAVRLGFGDADLLRAAGAFARHIGKFDAAIMLFERSVQLDPLHFNAVYLLADAYHRALRLDEALQWRQRYMELSQGGGYTLGQIYLLRGEPEAALAAFEGSGMNEYAVPAGRAMALHDLGRYDESREALREAIDVWGNEYPEEVAEVFAWIGDKDRAFEWLDKIYGDDIGRFFTQVYDASWIKIRDDPRWHVLRERAGMSEERLAAVEFNPVLPD